MVKVTKAIVLLSGGLDSAVALAFMELQAEPVKVEALTVDYGQRHAKEIDAACAIADFYDTPHRVVEVDPILFGGCALTGRGELPLGAATEPDATYVPARNTVLIALAAARAEALGYGNVVIGCNTDDAAAYPDCRMSYLAAMNDALHLGTASKISVYAPLLGHTKRGILRLAMNMGVPVGLTWSCYMGGSKPCKKCGACVTRYGEQDDNNDVLARPDHP